jgi:cyclopropane-fatty-acyl-phospholipid synthase
MMLKKNHKIPLDKFIDFCLYNKKTGYYMTKNPFGTKGDFTTSPIISRLFSEMIAIWTISFWESLGCPKKFNLIELGAGNGEMMKVMVESFKNFPSFLRSCNIFIYEKSPRLIKKQKANIKYRNIKWMKNLKIDNKFPNIFLANEFFDSIPIKQFYKIGNSWHEKFINISNDNKLSFVKNKIEIKNLDKRFNINILEKQNFIEFSPIGIDYLKYIFKIIDKKDGGLLIIDYGYNSKKMKNTLQAIFNKKHSNVLKNIGKSDITHEINFYLIEKILKNYNKLNAIYTSQKKFLTDLGINYRAEIIGKNKTFKEKADIFFRLQRLIGENEMGNLFKVMLIKKRYNQFKEGFKN